MDVGLPSVKWNLPSVKMRFPSVKCGFPSVKYGEGWSLGRPKLEFWVMGGGEFGHIKFSRGTSTPLPHIICYFGYIPSHSSFPIIYLSLFHHSYFHPSRLLDTLYIICLLYILYIFFIYPLLIYR